MPLTFQQFLAASEPAAHALHLTHSTSAKVALIAMEQLALRTAPCAEYAQQELLYLFYGRPAYKPARAAQAADIPELLPVCFVIDPAVLAQATRILPFDSGGFGRYHALLGPDLARADFELAGDPSAPARIVSGFYHSNRRYFDQQPAIGANEIPMSRPAARGYARLIADPALADDDDRRGSIEVQLNADLQLKDVLCAIVAPPLFLNDPVVLAALEACPDVDLVSYPTYGRHRPQDYSLLIYDRVDSFLASKAAFE